ncbi:MAG: FAD-dependent oxidoreductase, partial [Pseudomonadota bacterium]
MSESLIDITSPAGPDSDRPASRGLRDWPANPDVIIVGAGAAGLSAARTLRKKGLSCLILEAAERVGGRAWTENRSFGAPVDHGCSWISGADRNPFTKLAEDLGYTLVDHTNAGTDLFDLAGDPADDT